MKIFVTGHRGFIGRHLIPHLGNYKAYTGDILDKDALIDQMKGCDTVIHLAAKFGKVNSDLDIYKVNVIGTANVVQAMHENKISRIIFTSSCGAFNRFVNAYDDSKHIAERVLVAQGIIPIILRLSNLYGEDQKDKLIANVINNEGIVKVYGNGKQTRDFIHVDDVVQAITKSLNVFIPTTLEIGYGKSYSVLEVIDMIRKVSGKDIKIDFVPGGKDFPTSTVNITEAREVIGFNPTISLEEGLKKILWK